MRKPRWRSLSFTALSTILAVTAVPFPAFAEEGTQSVSDEYQLVWSDEFDGDSLNTDAWNVEQHEPGWVNAELQRYTGLDEGNIEVRDGSLFIKPHYTQAEESADEAQEVAAEPTVVELSYQHVKASTSTGIVQINFGAIGDFAEQSTAANVAISEVSLTDVTDPENPVDLTSSFDGSWFGGPAGDGGGEAKFEDGKAILNITNPGSENWHFQIQKTDMTLEEGHTYSFRMVATSNVDRAVEISVMDNSNWDWFAGTKNVIAGGSAEGSTGSGKSEITSGRITTQGKEDFTYGRFEARAKVPAGQGYLPAFWLMATDEGNYGQWPRCGEIDIMEVMGQNTSKSYHTIHYGYNSGSGHKENQGTKVLSDGSFSDEYHTYRVDWDPGQITWYVDDEQVYSTNDWYTGTDDDNQITYPAPFDQDFYVILNLAVGGSWVGYPDDDTYANMNDQAYEIDYVRVYQKSAEEYARLEAEAKAPEKEEVTFREADESGNYVVNGDFSREISLDGAADADKNNWKFHTQDKGESATYSISDGAITVTPVEAGDQNYSIQLKQENVPMYKGWEYELTFDAVATEERDIVIDVEGPDRGWIRYFNDTTVHVGTQKQSYSYTFTMNEKTDANGSLEFNFGKLTPAAAVTISNVRLTHKSGDAVAEDTSKTIRPDGNYVYNGSFDQGTGRLGYWEIDEADAQYVSVTNVGGKRELKVNVPEEKSVTVKQSALSPIGKGQYELSFNARTDAAEKDGLSIDMAGKTYVPELSDADASFAKKLLYDEDLSREDSNIVITFSKAGTYYLDNVFFTESALIKNGSFNAGMSSFAPYIHNGVTANYVIDSMNGNDNTFAITIEDTVAEDDGNNWYIQLNQDGVPLEQGKSYRLSFRIKSSIERNINYAMQQFEGNWTNYSKTGSVAINNEWQTVTAEFKMEDTSDPAARFNITMGSVGGVRITEKHDIYIDDISLVEIDEATVEPGTDDPTPVDPDPENPGPEEPGTEEPTPDQPGTDDPTPDQPGTDEPTPDDPGTVEPGTDEPTPDDPGTIESGTDEPTPDDPGTVEPQKPENNQNYYIPVQITRTVIKIVTRVAVTVSSILKRLFW
jgi:beta-glucanase (GH16 family)